MASTSDKLWADMSDDSDEEQVVKGPRNLLHRKRLEAESAAPPPAGRPLRRPPRQREDSADHRRPRQRPDPRPRHPAPPPPYKQQQHHEPAARPPMSATVTRRPQQLPTPAVSDSGKKVKLHLDVICDITKHADEAARNPSIFGEGKPREPVLDEPVVENKATARENSTAQNHTTGPREQHNRPARPAGPPPRAESRGEARPEHKSGPRAPLRGDQMRTEPRRAERPRAEQRRAEAPHAEPPRAEPPRAEPPHAEPAPAESPSPTSPAAAAPAPPVPAPAPPGPVATRLIAPMEPLAAAPITPAAAPLAQSTRPVTPAEPYKRLVTGSRPSYAMAPEHLYAAPYPAYPLCYLPPTGALPTAEAMYMNPRAPGRPPFEWSEARRYPQMYAAAANPLRAPLPMFANAVERLGQAPVAAEPPVALAQPPREVVTFARTRQAVSRAAPGADAGEKKTWAAVASASKGSTQ